MDNNDNPGRTSFSLILPLEIQIPRVLLIRCVAVRQEEMAPCVAWLRNLEYISRYLASSPSSQPRCIPNLYSIRGKEFDRSRCTQLAEVDVPRRPALFARWSNLSGKNGWAISGARIHLLPLFARACSPWLREVGIVCQGDWPEIVTCCSFTSDRKLVSTGRCPSTPTHAESRPSETSWLHSTRKERDERTSNNSHRDRSACRIAVFALVALNDRRLRPAVGKKRVRKGERCNTPWEPTAPFHGFCPVKVIRYYNESTLLSPPESLSYAWDPLEIVSW